MGLFPAGPTALPFRRFLVHMAAAVAVILSLSARGAIEPLLLGDGDRLLVLAPHPDDETLAAGGLIQEALLLDLPVQVCFFTLGADNELATLFSRRPPLRIPGAVRGLDAIRRNEALAAAAQLGLDPLHVIFLGYPDSATLDIWTRHWRDTPPYRSASSRQSSVPYEDALSPGAAFSGESVLEDLETVLRDFRPTLVVVPHPADHNPDHRALHLFTQIALWNLEPEEFSPRLLAYPLHFTQWPDPRLFQPLRPAFAPYFLRDAADWSEFELAPFQVSNKLAAIQRHASQSRLAFAGLDAHARKSELFSTIPPLRLPGGLGDAEAIDEDPSRFRPDDAMLQELSAQSGDGASIVRQVEAESRELAGHDNTYSRLAVSGNGRRLSLAFEFQEPLSPSAALAVQAFGYRTDTPFGQMPKLEIRTVPGRAVSVADLASPLPASSVDLAFPDDHTLVLEIPFGLLGQPDKILVGSQLASDTLPIDGLPWRVIDLSGAPPSTPLPPPTARRTPPAAAPPAPAAPEPAPPAPLTPRVRIPRKNLPERSEANEPVLW